MKNLENLEVQELSSNELATIDGGRNGACETAREFGRGIANALILIF